MVEEESKDQQPKIPENEIDIAKVAAEISISNLTSGVSHKRVREVILNCPLFENKGECVYEDDGTVMLMDNLTLMGYEVTVWLNYKPYKMNTSERDNWKMREEHTKACVRDGWGKIYVLLDSDVDNPEIALTVLEGMKHQAWGKFAELVYFADYDGF